MLPIKEYKLTKLVLNALESYIVGKLANGTSMKKIESRIEMFYAMTHGARDGHSHLTISSEETTTQFYTNIVSPIVEILVTDYALQNSIKYDIDNRIRNTDDVVEALYKRVLSEWYLVTKL